ncbi:MAG: OsmC family protein [Candidatus Binataceae bacterium]|nr:OsmC family protein [Candidatus Binataceae bacterium]
MKPLPHVYETRLIGGPSGYAQLSAAGVAEMSTAPPADFDGPGDAWSPELLLMAAVETCFLFTLRAVAAASKVEFKSLDLGGAGTVNREGGVTRFTEIVLRPSVVAPAGSDREKILRVLEKSERACLISASLATPVRLEPAITIEA